MTGGVDRNEGKLTVIVYDRGASIPATLPHSKHWGKIKRALSTLYPFEVANSGERDSVSLRLAMSRGQSSTGLEKHGKGLKVLKRVVDVCEKGRLQVISRYGQCIYQSGKKVQFEQMSAPLQGTLIQWDLWRPEWKATR